MSYGSDRGPPRATTYGNCLEAPYAAILKKMENHVCLSMLGWATIKRYVRAKSQNWVVYRHNPPRRSARIHAVAQGMEHMSPRASKILSAITLCALAPGAALAQAELMFGLCRKIPDDAARLKCFDAIVPAPQKTDQPKAVQEWSIEDSKSPVDNSPEVFATLTSEDGRSELIIRCKERKIELAVLPSGLFAIESGTVLLQVNDGPAVTASWSASSNSKGLFASNAIALIKRLPDGGKLFVRATGYSRQADDATFHLGAVTVVKNRVSAACKSPPEDASSPPKTGPAPRMK